MQRFRDWLESNMPMKLGGKVPIKVQYEIMNLAKNYNYTGKDITSILQKNGYEFTYPQVMSILTPLFRQRKSEKRLDKLNLLQNLPHPIGVTGPQYTSTYVRPSPHEEPPEESSEFAYDPDAPNVGAFNPARSGLNMMKKRRNREVY